MTLFNQHCFHETDTARICCHCGTANAIQKEWVPTPDELHGPHDPSGHFKDVPYEEVPCIAWSWRDLSEQPCDECNDTGIKRYVDDDDYGGRPRVREFDCGCRNYKPHEFYENASLDKCRRCQLRGEHGIHNVASVCNKIQNRIECVLHEYPYSEAMWPDRDGDPLPCNSSDDEIGKYLQTYADRLKELGWKLR